MLTQLLTLPKLYGTMASRNTAMVHIDMTSTGERQSMNESQPRVKLLSLTAHFTNTELC